MSDNNKSKGNLLQKIGNGFGGWCQKYFPDAIIFAIGLFLLVFVLGIVITHQSPFAMWKFAGDGIFNLLAFSTQVALTLMFSSVVANTKQVDKLLDKLTDIPKTPMQAYIFTYVIACIGHLLSWAIGLVVGGILCQHFARKMKGVDYPFMVATAYCALAIWHGGLSGTIPLAIGTEGSICADYLEELIPSNQFFFHPVNIILIVLCLVLVPLVITRTLAPPADKVFELDPNLLKKDDLSYPTPPKEEWVPIQHVEFGKVFKWILGILILGYYCYYFSQKGIGGLDLNSLNGVLFGVGVCLCDHLMDFGARVKNAAAGMGALFVQFPIYAMIMAMTTGSGLATVLSNAIVSIATPTTMPNIINISSSILNMIIPSGGGKFSVEAPIYIPAIYKVGAPMVTTLLGSAWGDALTNLIQPFWALPLLAIAKLSVRDIVGYCVIYCAFFFVVIQVVLTIWMNTMGW